MPTQLDFVYEHEKKRPNDVWLTQPTGGGDVEDFTFARAVGEARRMAAHLESLKLPKRSHVALFSKNCAWWLLADLAIWMAGHVSVPLYPTLTPETIRQILEHSEAKLIFVGKLDGWDRMKAGIPDAMPKITTPLAPNVEGATKWSDVIARTEPISGSPSRDPDELATIIYTSGSTGVPKGVMHTFRTMCAGLKLAEVAEISAADRILSYLPLAHALERAAVEIPSMRFGYHVFFAESLDTFLADLRRARPTMFVSVPRLWSKFQQGVYSKMPPEKLRRLLSIPIVSRFVRRKILDGLGLGAVRYAASGSAPISEELMSFYRSLGLELLEGYGMTENFAVSHATRPGEERLGYIGRPHDGVEHRITESGEVLVKSPGTMLGYFKADDLTKEMIDDEGFLHTGDRGEVDELGRLKITGRVKELFKTSKGKYVAPTPIENVLMQHDDVEQALVSGVGMPQPFGMVVLSDAARARAAEDAAREALVRSLEQHLERTNAGFDPHEHLEKIVIVREQWTIENGLLTPTLKVKRDQIEKRYADHVPRWYGEKPRVLWE